MTDFRDELRDFLQRRADDVPPHREVPRSLAPRARRRIALNALVVGAAVAVLAGGALAGVRAFGAFRRGAGRGADPVAGTTDAAPHAVRSAKPLGFRGSRVYVLAASGGRIDEGSRGLSRGSHRPDQSLG